jgi:hypothetical protein
MVARSRRHSQQAADLADVLANRHVVAAHENAQDTDNFL